MYLEALLRFDFFGGLAFLWSFAVYNIICKDFYECLWYKSDEINNANENDMYRKIVIVWLINILICSPYNWWKYRVTT